MNKKKTEKGKNYLMKIWPLKCLGTNMFQCSNCIPAMKKRGAMKPPTIPSSFLSVFTGRWHLLRFIASAHVCVCEWHTSLHYSLMMDVPPETQRMRNWNDAASFHIVQEYVIPFFLSLSLCRHCGGCVCPARFARCVYVFYTLR